MKKKGSKSDFTGQRNSELKAAFFSQDVYSTSDAVLSKVVKTPASRFWVDPDRARDVLSAIEKNPELLTKMHRERRRMYETLLDKYNSIREQYPGLSRVNCVSMAIYSGAPEFFITTSTARSIIYSTRN